MELTNLLKSIAHVSDNSNDLTSFTVANPLIPETKPTHVVSPKDFQELQKLIKAANENKLALVPVSSTGPHYRGGIACAEDYIAVDLSSWKKIPSIQRRNRVCMVEPGVTYGELLPALAEQGMTIPTPLAPRAGKSVLAAMMDREPTLWPRMQWDIQDPVGATEIIFGTGDQFRTGSAAASGTLDEQRKGGVSHKGPLGPSATDFQKIVQGSQGSMGIVTWISLRCEIKPTVEKTYVLGGTLEALTPYVYDVQRVLWGEHSFLLNKKAAEMLMGKGKNLPEFVCLQNIAGFDIYPKERLKYQEEDIKKIAARYKLSLEKTLGSISADDLLKTAINPCGEKDWRHSLKGNCLSIIMMTTLDRVPEFIKVFNDCADKHKVNKDEIGIYVQPIVQNHSVHVEFMIPYDTAQIDTMRSLEEEAIKALNNAHAFFSRPYGTAAKIVFQNNPKNTDLLKMVKGMFDPKRILNPGKFGL